jgi:thermostable 8-oxoguanine DNA glycosylase
MHQHRQSPILDASTLREAAQRYDYAGSSLLGDTDPRFPHAGDGIRERGYVLREELYQIARWKSPRRAALVHRNDLREVHRLSGKALAQRDRDPARAAGLLTELWGIGIPMASAVLTVVDPQNFGLVDVRAWATLRRWRPDRFPSKHERYWTVKYYVHCLETMRELAQISALSCREIDMALWQMDREWSSRKAQPGQRAVR